MATKAQINANRQNAQKSTGPGTTEGKAVASKNALKHGLCSQEAVIHGEDRTEFELHREALLAEWLPAGPTESLLAERIVSLSWRLRRAERMESQAIDDLIIETADNGEVARSMLKETTRRTLADAGTLDRDLSLGKAVVTDFTNYRVLDRLMLYERRMDNSLQKTIRLLKKLQIMRRIEHDAAERKSREESPPAPGRMSDLKKRTQFPPELMGTKPCRQKGYDDRSPTEQRENKANQSQFQTPGRICAGGKGEIAAALRASQ